MKFLDHPDTREAIRRYTIAGGAVVLFLAGGVGVWAARGDGYEDGTLSANGRERWGDMAFRTDAPTRSLWHTLSDDASHSATSKPRLVIPLLTANWLALGMLLTALSAAWGRSAQP